MSRTRELLRIRMYLRHRSRTAQEDQEARLVPKLFRELLLSRSAWMEVFLMLDFQRSTAERLYFIRVQHRTGKIRQLQ